jgi:hypothetical protein
MIARTNPESSTWAERSKPQTLDEIDKRICLTRERVRQIEKKPLENFLLELDVMISAMDPPESMDWRNLLAVK